MVYIWQLAALDLDGKILVSGTLLKGKKRSSGVASTIVGNFFQVMISYFLKPYSNGEVTIQSNQNRIELKTNEKGHISTLIDGSLDEDLKVVVNGKELEIPQNYPSQFGLKNSNIEVISDIDDTVIHSHTASFVKRIATILLLLPQKRRAVVYTFRLFEKFRKLNFRINYLSKSEGNLFGLITSIFKFHKLPLGSLFLTQYLDFKGLVKGTKAKNHKEKYLRLILGNMPSKKFILLGDDTQKDMEVYASVAKDFGDRILKVYIRQTGLTRNESQELLWKNLENTGLNAIYFTDDDLPNQEIEYWDKHLNSEL